jgi:beta-lactam-binding protein with PASTA domain
MAEKKNTAKGKDFPGKWFLKHLVAAFIVLVALIVGAIIFLNVVTQHNKELIVPDLSNLSVEDARVEAEKNKMVIDVTDSVFVKRMKRGSVYRQNPAPGSKVKQGRRIALTINAVNAKKVTMPNLVGFSMRQAKAELLSRGLVLGKLIYIQDMATNNVLKQLYRNNEIEPGTMIESESVVDLVVGLNGHDFATYVPDVIGLKYMSAVDAVHDNSLNISKLRFDKTVKDYDDSLNAMVYNQEPEPSDSVQVNMGEEVTLFLTVDVNKIPVREEKDDIR